MGEFSKRVQGRLLDLSYGGRVLTVDGLSDAALKAVDKTNADEVLIQFVAKFGRPAVPISGNAQVIGGPPFGDGVLLEEILTDKGLL